MLRVAVAQMDSTDNKKENIEKFIKFLEMAHKKDAEIIVAPETFIYRGNSEGYKTVAEEIPGITTDKLLKKSEEYGISIICGLIERGYQKPFNTVVLIKPNTEIVAYRKTHLFKISDYNIDESRIFERGFEFIVNEVSGIKIGIMVCFEIRFPEVARILALKGSDVIVVPSNFTARTGKHHWEPLLKARAIENELFIVAVNETGTNRKTGVKSFGHSMVVNPWGETVLKAGVEEGLFIADLDISQIKTVRKRVPIFELRRNDLYELRY